MITNVEVATLSTSTMCQSKKKEKVNIVMQQEQKNDRKKNPRNEEGAP